MEWYLPVVGVLTQFRKPSASGVIGLLAHNYAAGMWFDQFEIGTMLYVIHGDGSNDVYRLTEKAKFQALQGNSVMSDLLISQREAPGVQIRSIIRSIQGNRILTLQNLYSEGC